MFTAGCAAVVDSIFDDEPEVATKVGPIDPSPLSGRENGLNKPILVLKIDNLPKARPHEGLTAADQIYLERIEGGYSRMAAVFATNLPASIGPVRSARPTDISILRQFGAPAFGYSGAQTRLIPLLDREAFVDISNRVTGDGWYRDPAPRFSPHNLMVRPARLIELAQAKREVSTAIKGFSFSRNFVPAATEANKVTVKYPATATEFRWVAGAGWQVYFDGELAKDSLNQEIITASTVIIQFTKLEASGLKDSFGNNVPVQQLMGTGQAILLRNGKQLEVEWSRLAESDFPTFTYEGEGVTLKSGQVWIVYATRSEVLVESNP